MGGRVMIVDDNADAADSLAMYLELEGYDVATYGSGEQAVAAACTGTFDVAVLDLGMPVMDGYAVCRELRRLVPRTRLLAWSGWCSEADRRRTAQAGFDAHLGKTAPPQEVARVLAALCADEAAAH